MRSFFLLLLSLLLVSHGSSAVITGLVDPQPAYVHAHGTGRRRLSPNEPHGSFLWEKAPPYLPLSAQPVVYHHRGGEIQMSLNVQVSRLIPLRTNT
ncbi:hypothetical protein GBF38_012880 [Nibea albiflora]|uniref:Uncharacterized protein n=1 Tax=Nibea albiflora TaxID=240163 RepID=A0ACB7EZS4_NIBAL|nr:hypothetical protein GBF38_012880 [Nibea albiflora]